MLTSQSDNVTYTSGPNSGGVREGVRGYDLSLSGCKSLFKIKKSCPVFSKSGLSFSNVPSPPSISFETNTPIAGYTVTLAAPGTFSLPVYVMFQGPTVGRLCLNAVWLMAKLEALRVLESGQRIYVSFQLSAICQCSPTHSQSPTPVMALVAVLAPKRLEGDCTFYSGLGGDRLGICLGTHIRKEARAR